MNDTNPATAAREQMDKTPAAIAPARWLRREWQWPKVELVRLFQGHGPGWMLAAVVVLTLPTLLLAGGFLLRSLAEFWRALG